MNRQFTEVKTDPREIRIQENIAKWQSTENPLAPLSEEHLDLIYELEDIVAATYKKPEQQIESELSSGPVQNNDDKHLSFIPKVIVTMQDFIEWTIDVEKDIKHENLKNFQNYYELISDYQSESEKLFRHSTDTLNSLNDLKKEYENVTKKTNYLYDLSEQVMNNQKKLKETKQALTERLKYFTNFNKYQEKIEHLNNKTNTQECIEILDKIDESIKYLNSHLRYKESRIYKMKYESLLTNVLNKIYDYVNHVLIETMKQVVDPDSKTQILPQAPNATNALVDSAFSLYYGKFQSASLKVKIILSALEEREENNEHYRNLLLDCQKSYLTQRLPVLNVAVRKALMDLKEKHKTDFSVLFRSCSLFTMKVCQDEGMCYNYFFGKVSDLFNDYLGSLCQNLYDILRPSLISINHIEVLSELCGILKGEMLNDRVLEMDGLVRYVEAIRQLLQDVEERLVFRTNIFFQHDLLGYKPSPGDLAYPEKLEQLENVAIELREKRLDSRASIVSLESHEVAQINSAQVAHFRSYTGNSAADLHGLWYPTVKRTLVCLSRLYFCLDRNTFQGLAQEALVICVQTIESAANLISGRKTAIDGQLFQIKHLLIIREQIAPFQVDFTTKQMALDFSSVQKATIDLIQHRKNIFTFGSNNALLEFLLEGTPKVKEYSVDSRKEIDKQLKLSCEVFIAHATELLIVGFLGNILMWIKKAEHIRKIIQAENSAKQDLTVAKQDFGKADVVAQVVKIAQKNMKKKIPEVQRSLQLYLANRETEFILFRPIKNNIINAFIQLDQILLIGGYSSEDQLLIACPSPEQINILICSVSLAINQDVKQNVT